MSFLLTIFILLCGYCSAIDACDWETACIVARQSQLCDTYWTEPSSDDVPAFMERVKSFAVEPYTKLFGLMSIDEASREIDMWAHYDFIPSRIQHQVKEALQANIAEGVYSDSYITEQQLGYYFVAIRNMYQPPFVMKRNEVAMAFVFLRWTISASGERFPLESRLEVDKLKQYIAYQGLKLMRSQNIDQYRSIRRALQDCKSSAPPQCLVR